MDVEEAAVPLCFLSYPILGSGYISYHLWLF